MFAVIIAVISAVGQGNDDVALAVGVKAFLFVFNNFTVIPVGLIRLPIIENLRDVIILWNYVSIVKAKQRLDFHVT